MFLETEIGEFVKLDSISYFEFDYKLHVFDDGSTGESPCQVFARCTDGKQFYIGVYHSQETAKKFIRRMLFIRGKLIPFSELDDDIE